MHPRFRVAATIAALSALALAGCAAPTPQSGGGVVRVVASTNVYGDIAAAIGGDRVKVTSILDNPAQDPHSFEANAQVQLELSKAAIVIENGGGYDDWTDTLLAGANNPGAVVLNASDLSGYDKAPAGGQFNEHVFYDFPTMSKLADAVAAAMTGADPAGKETFLANARKFEAGLATLQQREAAIKAAHSGTGVAITEPVPGYMLEASGLVDVTPAEFSEAVEAGTDVSPLVLARTLALFDDGTAKVLVYNAQTSGAETDQVIAQARKDGIPTVPVSETLPAGLDYLGWMSSNLDAIEAALA